MTPLSEYVFEKFHVRKSKKQKDGFIDYIKEFAKKEGYSCRVEKGSFGARNIVIGDPARAKAIYTAHYDTCARLPFPNFNVVKFLQFINAYPPIFFTVNGIVCSCTL